MEQHARAFLRRILATPGILSGTDLVTGQAYSTIIPRDVEAFLHAHALGPARSEPLSMVVITTSGEREEKCTHVRSMVSPCTSEGQTTHVAVRFKTPNSLSPTEEIIAASLALRRAGIVHYLERSVITGVWVIWVPFDKAVARVHAESLAGRIREILKMIGIPQTSYAIPLLEAEPTMGLHLPCMFFSGLFFGVLFDVDEEGYLHAVDAAPTQVGERTVEMTERGHVPDPSGSVDGLLERWAAIHGNRAVRAGELVVFGREHGVLPERFSALSPQAAAISLGRELLGVAGGGKSAYHVTSTRSGNSCVFRVAKRSEAEAKP